LPVSTRSKTWAAAARFLEHIAAGIAKSESHYSKILTRTTLYTSLESCAQCSGLMALGAVPEVVFLQPDPSQNCIGNIMYSLNGKGCAFQAPRPIPAHACGVREYGRLERKYELYAKEKGTPASITSFLCTDSAGSVFRAGQRTLRGLQLKHPRWKPKAIRDSLTNEEVWRHAIQYAVRAAAVGRRGTPH
jgi:hypothetical protein